MEKTIIDTQFENGSSLLTYLMENKELTFHNEAENTLKKTMILSSASYFETEVTQIMTDCAKSHSCDNELIVSLIEQKAIKRQYHTYFDWEDTVNANKFFSLFGTQFKKKMASMVKENSTLEDSIRSFISIGHKRNLLVHKNFAEYSVSDQTVEEIYNHYKSALYFIKTIKDELIKKDYRANP